MDVHEALIGLKSNEDEGTGQGAAMDILKNILFIPNSTL